ncbi:MAG: LON peptidase substrate-binding domain-containing protein, partial [Desulfobacterales bacterium]
MKTRQSSPDDKSVVSVDDYNIPDDIPILPLDNQVAFPKTNMSLAFPIKASGLIEAVTKGDQLVGFVGSKRQTGDDLQHSEMHEIGTVARILYATRTPDNTMLLVAHGLKRFRISQWIPGEDFLRARIELIPEIIEDDIESAALHRSLGNLAKEIFAMTFDGPEEAVEKLSRISDPLHLAYVVAAYSEIDFETRQLLLEEDSLKAKLRKLTKILTREKEILSLGKKI